MSLKKYIGRTIVIIYMDRKGVITQRTIRINRIESGKALAYDYDKRAPRPFVLDRILAAQPVGRAS